MAVGVASAIGTYRACWWVAWRGRYYGPCAEVNVGLPYLDRGQQMVRLTSSPCGGRAQMTEWLVAQMAEEAGGCSVVACQPLTGANNFTKKVGPRDQPRLLQSPVRWL